jgi:hypothetical protein
MTIQYIGMKIHTRMTFVHLTFPTFDYLNEKVPAIRWRPGLDDIYFLLCSAIPSRIAYKAACVRLAR